jgi:leucyl-tRNA synthetase
MEKFIRDAYTLVTTTAHNPTDEQIDREQQHALRRLTHQTIERATTDLRDFQFNTMVAALIEFKNGLWPQRNEPIARTAAWREAIETLVLLMAPSTPYVAEELWERLGKPYSVHTQPWPVFDPALTREETVEVVVQINGKVRDKVTLPVALPEAEARALVLARERVRELVGDRTPARVVYVPGRLINIVVRQ